MSSPELPSSTQRHHRVSTTRFHGAVLWPAGCLVTWVRPWDARVARCRTCSSMLGCTDTMVITIADRAAEQDGRGQWMPQARGAAAMLLKRVATFTNVIRSSDSQLDDRGRAQAVVHVGQSGRRETPRRWSTWAVWQAEGVGTAAWLPRACCTGSGGTC